MNLRPRLSLSPTCAHLPKPPAPIANNLCLSKKTKNDKTDRKPLALCKTKDSLRAAASGSPCLLRLSFVFLFQRDILKGKKTPLPSVLEDTDRWGEGLGSGNSASAWSLRGRWPGLAAACFTSSSCPLAARARVARMAPRMTTIFCEDSLVLFVGKVRFFFNIHI